jgi:CO/xanthine dehydrogenase FAD-binding subunit
MKIVCLRETGRNLREMSTLAGTLVGANGRSPLAIAMLAAGSQVSTMPENEEVTFERFLRARKNASQPWMITRFTVDTKADVKTEFIARSPADLPVVGVAVARWSNGQIRIAAGGFGDAPVLAYEGNDPIAAVSAVETAFIASDDEWASSEYRKAAAVMVVQRLLKN